jgi:hypothetical protein
MDFFPYDRQLIYCDFTHNIRRSAWLIRLKGLVVLGLIKFWIIDD